MEETALYEKIQFNTSISDDQHEVVQMGDL